MSFASQVNEICVKLVESAIVLNDTLSGSR